MANTTAVVNQLRALYDLTRIEVATTRARATQAGTAVVRRELLANAAAAAGRAERIAQVLKGLGAAPDPVTAAVGWASTAVRTALEQAQPLDQALLGDLALQHQLAERGRYLLTRAGDAPPAVQELAAQLVDDHLDTIDRLRHVLAELASGGPSELRPPPLQALTLGFVRMALLPTRLTVEGLQRVTGALRRRRPDDGASAADAIALPGAVDGEGAAAGAVSAPAAADAAEVVVPLRPTDVATDLDPADVTADLAPADSDADLAPADIDADLEADIDVIDAEAGDMKSTVSDPDLAVDTAAEAALTVADPGVELQGLVVDEERDATEQVTEPAAALPGPAADPTVGEIATEAARSDDTTDDADAASRPSVNSAAADELPIRDYDSLPVRGVVIALRGINDDADLTAVEQYERSHKNRAGVLTAVQNRTEALAHDTARG